MDKEDSGNDFVVDKLVVLQSKRGQSNSINVLELEKKSPKHQFL